ncbi:MAG: hypothetical protein ACKV19_25395 [Verrucomicrobiales bacterium]
MKHFLKDFGRGLLYAIPVLVVAGLAVAEIVRLRGSVHEAEARRLAAERALARVEAQLAARFQEDDRALTARLKAAADAAETQGVAEDRLSRVIDFLKQEVATAESTIKALRQGATGSSPNATGTDNDGHEELVREISRLNAEIEALRAGSASAAER